MLLSLDSILSIILKNLKSFNVMIIKKEVQ